MTPVFLKGSLDTCNTPLFSGPNRRLRWVIKRQKGVGILVIKRQKGVGILVILAQHAPGNWWEKEKILSFFGRVICRGYNNNDILYYIYIHIIITSSSTSIGGDGL